MNMMTVYLSYNLPNSTKTVDKRTAEVRSWAEASRAVRRYIFENDLTGSTWSGGTVRIGGKRAGHISYNGRAWDIHGDVIAQL